MKLPDAVVHVVDDDPAVRNSLRWLIESIGVSVQTHEGGQEFLERFASNGFGACPCCVVLDIRMPGMGGLEVQSRLAAADEKIPVIIVTGYADVPCTVRAMKAGAVEFIEKPFRDQELLDCIQRAIQRHSALLQREAEIQRIRDAIATLTECEREVMLLVVRGHQNKAIAEIRDCARKTVEVHRAAVMRKMGAATLADLIRMVFLVDGTGENPQTPR